MLVYQQQGLAEGAAAAAAAADGDTGMIIMDSAPPPGEPGKRTAELAGVTRKLPAQRAQQAQPPDACVARQDCQELREEGKGSVGR